MNYTLIASNGRVYTFYLEATAVCYQGAYGGVIITKEILEIPETAEV